MLSVKCVCGSVSLTFVCHRQITLVCLGVFLPLQDEGRCTLSHVSCLDERSGMCLDPFLRSFIYCTDHLQLCDTNDKNTSHQIHLNHSIYIQYMYMYI